MLLTTSRWRDPGGANFNLQLFVRARVERNVKVTCWKLVLCILTDSDVTDCPTRVGLSLLSCILAHPVYSIRSTQQHWTPFWMSCERRLEVFLHSNPSLETLDRRPEPSELWNLLNFTPRKPKTRIKTQDGSWVEVHAEQDLFSTPKHPTMWGVLSSLFCHIHQHRGKPFLSLFLTPTSSKSYTSARLPAGKWCCSLENGKKKKHSLSFLWLLFLEVPWCY